MLVIGGLSHQIDRTEWLGQGDITGRMILDVAEGTGTQDRRGDTSRHTLVGEQVQCSRGWLDSRASM